MNPFKHHPYLVAIFVMFFIMLGLFSLSYCGGKEDAQMDARDLIIEQQKEQIEALEKQIDVASDASKKSKEDLTEVQYKLEIKIYQYDQLRKKTITIPTRNTDVYDDSLVRIWANQNKE
jgi:hypothetical protein